MIVMHTANCPFDTGAGGNLICSFRILREWTNRIKHHRLPFLHTATKNLLALDKQILAHRHRGTLNTRIWFRFALHPVVDILPSTGFLDRFIRSKFPFKKSDALTLTPGGNHRISATTHCCNA